VWGHELTPSGHRARREITSWYDADIAHRILHPTTQTPRPDEDPE
jgi:hypothetical protein